MRKNWNLKIVGGKVTLVPYRHCHVAKYHEWMKDPYLQEMTASEPLSLSEEYEMQTNWRDDETKCTFILLDSSDGPEKMVGDVNLYFHDSDEPTTGEIEIMIAEPSCRRKGLATEALKLFMNFAITTLGTVRFVAKISNKNAPSIGLFTSLGYNIYKLVDVFEETHMDLHVTADSHVAEFGKNYQVEEYLPTAEEDKI